MQNTGLDEAQAGIKITERNINNLNMQMTSSYGRKQREIKKASWWKWKRRVKKLA